MPQFYNLEFITAISMLVPSNMDLWCYVNASVITMCFVVARGSMHMQGFQR